VRKTEAILLCCETSHPATAEPLLVLANLHSKRFVQAAHRLCRSELLLLLWSWHQQARFQLPPGSLCI